MQHIFSWWNPVTAFVVGVVCAVHATRIPYLPDGPTKTVAAVITALGFFWSVLVFATM